MEQRICVHFVNAQRAFNAETVELIKMTFSDESIIKIKL